MTNKFTKSVLLLGLGITLSGSVLADHATSRATNFSATLNGFQEVPAVFTRGSGSFRAWLSYDKLYFSFRYNNLAGQITAAHIHFAQPGVNGGVFAFICSNSNGAVSPSTNVPSCPEPGERLQGMITSDDVLENTEQGISAGDFYALKQAIKNSAVYINVHSDAFPSGELRGNLEYSADSGAKTSEKSDDSSQTNKQYPDNTDDDESSNEFHRKYK
ncbi:CHRD domain-containing protein [Photobacterium sp. TY1-4]|uniref:CHRD domain-containing protein n=1 Tax=Photobacterium sp. TY1-4 TaxID=2899122 RepID=UPI0021C1E6E3|nr:CHRD domain-containing protein [Photobacterium sp. TY1-4]UXI02595.1 CHRD domain-containing protein [Photobacterium sp. TY1-4]